MDWIRQYVDEEIDFKTFEFEMTHLIAEDLEQTLDSGSPSVMSSSTAKASAQEDQLREDVDALMETIWNDIRDHGYRLHTALIRA